jgi:hypothetical protein
MILQIRTKDNLEALLKQGNSPAWVIAESRVAEIKSVEIYQFDGKRVLKADFDAAKSTRTESVRLVVAFTNGVIEDADHDWNGQNPVRYKDVTSNDTPEAQNELFDNWIPFSELERIEQAYQSKSESLPDILNEILETYNYKYSGWVYFSSYNEILEQIDSLRTQYFTNVIDFSNALDEIKSDTQENNIKIYYLLELLSRQSLNMDGILIKSLSPSGTEDYSCLIMTNKKIIIPLLILHHFYDAKNQAVGWYDEYLSIYGIPYSDYLTNNELNEEISLTSLIFNIEESNFGPIVKSNKLYLNMTKDFYNCSVAGILAAKKFC